MLQTAVFVRDEPHGHTIQDVCCLLEACCLLGLLFEGTADKMDGALRILLITFRFSAIFLVISRKRYIFAEKSNV